MADKTQSRRNRPALALHVPEPPFRPGDVDRREFRLIRRRLRQFRAEDAIPLARLKADLGIAR